MVCFVCCFNRNWTTACLILSAAGDIFEVSALMTIVLKTTVLISIISLRPFCMNVSNLVSHAKTGFVNCMMVPSGNF
jgi:hypothetical protein